MSSSKPLPSPKPRHDATLHLKVPSDHPLHRGYGGSKLWVCMDTVGTGTGSGQVAASHWHNGDGRGWVVFHKGVPHGMIGKAAWLQRALPGYDAAPIPGFTWSGTLTGFAVWPAHPITA